MFEQIEKELDGECSKCQDKENCRKYDCVVYRILKIITSYDIEVSSINIDDFFENDAEYEQIGLMEVLG